MTAGEQMVVTEVGYTVRDGEYFMFVAIPGQAEQLFGPFQTQDAVQAVIDDFSKMCESAGGMAVPGGLAN